MTPPSENSSLESSSPDNSPAAHRHDPYAALREPNFRRFASGNIIAILGTQMQSVAVGWEIYERTNSAMALGWVGFCQVLPIIALSMFTGQVADRYDRGKILMIVMTGLMIVSFSLAAISFWQLPIPTLYACLILNGVARAFQQPARSSLLPQIVPRSLFANAVTWNMSGFHLAATAGPALGGFLIAMFRSAAVVYLADAVAAGTFFLLLMRIDHRPVESPRQEMTLRTLIAGMQFVWQTKVILGAMALDMFAVLLGGATTLLPIYAKDILRVGPVGLGWLQAAPAIGALIMSFGLAHRPPFERAGRSLLWAVAGFGVATIVFGASRVFGISFVALLLAGACDNISVVIRHTLVQLTTPDVMRGRVSAVNGVFIGASNELGGFESGLVAALFSPTFAVVAGGFGTILVVSLVALLWPELRRYGRLDGSDRSPLPSPADLPLTNATSADTEMPDATAEPAADDSLPLNASAGEPVRPSPDAN